MDNVMFASQQDRGVLYAGLGRQGLNGGNGSDNGGLRKGDYVGCLLGLDGRSENVTCPAFFYTIWTS